VANEEIIQLIILKAYIQINSKKIT